MESTSGLCVLLSSLAANVFTDSKNCLCPSLYRMLYAREDFPLPDTPTKQIIFLRGNSTEIFFRLFSLAPFMIMFSTYVLSQICG